jgi:hypothetical protein
MVIDVLSRVIGGETAAVPGNHERWDGAETEQLLVGESAHRHMRFSFPNGRDT